MRKFKYLVLSVVAALGMASCANSYEYNEGKWDASQDYAEVSFPTKTKTIELDPSESTVSTFTLERKNKKGDLKVEFEQVENTDSAFTFTAAEFKDGDSIATFDVDFSKAGLGKPYTLSLKVSDPALVSSYNQGTMFTFNVTRIKWNSLGNANFYEDFILGFDRDIELQQRDDNKSYYRLVQPFANIGGIDGAAASQYITFRILKPKDVVRGITITTKDLVYFDDINTGYFHSSYGDYIYAYHPSKFTSMTESNFTFNRVLEYQADGETPGQVQLAPYYYIPGVGGWNKTASDGQMIITFPGFTPVPDADINTDFDWEEDMTGSFKSPATGKTINATLYKGTCIAPEKSAEKFAQQYGTLYALETPYSENNMLMFCAKDGRIFLPKGCESQATGMTALSEDVYANINAAASLFTEGKSVSLNITFTNKEGTIEYGTFDEVWQNIKWNKLGKGQFTEGFFIPLWSGDPVTYEVDVEEREDMPGLYRINAFCNSVYPYAEDDCAPDGTWFEINATDPDGVYVPFQDLGFIWNSGYGHMYFESYGGYALEVSGMTFAQLKSQGYFGTVKDGVITLPIFTSSNGNKYVGLITFEKTSTYYSGDQFKLVLPSAAKSKMLMTKPVSTASKITKKLSAFKMANSKRTIPFSKGKKVQKPSLKSQITPMILK